MRTFSKAASKVAFHESGSSKSGPKYGPGDKPDNYKTTRYSDKDSKHYRGHRGHGGTTPPSYTLVHITDIDTMYRLCCISINNSSSPFIYLCHTVNLR